MTSVAVSQSAEVDRTAFMVAETRSVSLDDVLTVSVNDMGRLSYAAMFGPARMRGTEFLLDALQATGGAQRGGFAHVAPS